jgi:hypothetical protein
VLRRAAGERLLLSSEVVDRIEYAFAGTPWRRADPDASYGVKRSGLNGEADAQRSS